MIPPRISELFNILDIMVFSMEELIDIAAWILASIGVAIIFYAGAVAAVKFVIHEVRRSLDHTYHSIREDFTHKLILGLDFLIGADIIRTILVPTLEEVGILAAIVAIRTTMSYFLNREARELEASEV